MPFEPVHAPLEHRTPHLDQRVDLDPDPLPGGGCRRDEVGRGAPGHGMSLGALALLHPPGGEAELCPAALDLGLQGRGINVAELGDDVVHEGADRCRGTLDAVAATGPQQPSQLALGELLDLGRRDPHGLVRATPGTIVGGGDEGPPLPRVGSGHAIVSEPRQLPPGPGGRYLVGDRRRHLTQGTDDSGGGQRATERCEGSP